MAKNQPDLIRCPWAKGDQYVEYHDREWGMPVHDDRLLFEFLILEGAQAGLSWATILKKRDNYREAFDQFDPWLVAKYGKAKQAELMANAGIVRNRLKIESAIDNAKAFVVVQHEVGSFDQFIWSFVGGTPLQNSWRSIKMMKIHQLDPSWTLPSRLDDNLMAWMIQVNGFMMDVRHAPREVQEIAFNKGLIPHIPADRQ